MPSTQTTYDLAIVGGGPGGYVAAIRAAQLGLKPAIIERERMGGVCLNWGCIPTKALLRNAELALLMQRREEFGISCDNLRFDLKKAVARSRKAADQLSRGIESLLKKHAIPVIAGQGRLLSASRVGVTDTNGKAVHEIQAKSIILATGSRSKVIPPVPVDGTRIITSTEAMLLEHVPASMTIIGGGAIGVEFAYFYAAYGTKVTVIEMLPALLPLEDAEISQTLARAFGKLGIKVMTGARVERAEAGADGTTVIVSSNGKSETIRGDLTLLAIGRDPNSQNLGLEELGVATERGFITVDDGYQTTVPGIYAVGDVTGPPLLAHVASAEGINLVERLAGLAPAPIDYNNIPNCVYCQPQVASVGLTEAEAAKRGEIKVFKMPFRASGKAVALGETEGMVKLIADAKYGEILGAHLIGSEATELIAEICTARTLETTAAEVRRTIHAHPTLSEMIMEAAAGIDGEAIHV